MTSAPTATRTIDSKGRATVQVALPDGRTFATTGTRAANAEAVIITRWTEQDTEGVYGLRGDFLKAQTEATTLRTRTEMVRRVRGRVVRSPLNRPEVAYVIRVEEAR